MSTVGQTESYACGDMDRHWDNSARESTSNISLLKITFVYAGENVNQRRVAMSIELLQKLEDKIDNALETIELLRLQNDELEEKYAKLLNENNTLKNKHAAWEQNLTTMLEKLDAIEPKAPMQKVEHQEAISA